MIDPFSLEGKYYDHLWGSEQNRARYEAETKFLHKVLTEHNASRVLDLACGPGGHCLGLAQLGYEVVGLDVSKTMLEKARKKLSEARMRCEFVLGDMSQADEDLKNANVSLSFDAVISLGYSFAHLTDDLQLKKTLVSVYRLLRTGGVLAFCVRNAAQLRDDLIRQLRLDETVNEPNLQLAVLGYNYRDESNPDVLVWNSVWLINEDAKIDFQVRRHLLRFYRHDLLMEHLEGNGFSVVSVFGDTFGGEEFDSNRHDIMLVVCIKE